MNPIDTNTGVRPMDVAEQRATSGGNIFSDAIDGVVYLYEKHIAEPAREIIRRMQNPEK